MDATVFVGPMRYDVVYDRAPRHIVFVRGTLSDEGGGGPLPPPLDLGVDEPLLAATVTASGYALAGDPEVALTDAGIAHPLALTVAPPGYRPLQTTVTIPVAPLFPIDADLVLRRRPLRLAGRVTVLASGLGIAGARLTIAGPPLPAPRRAVLVARPMPQDVPQATPCQGHIVSAIVSPVPIKAAVQAAGAGAEEVPIDNREGLAAGQLVRFGPLERQHWAEILAVSPTPANLALPGTITLTEPLAWSVRPGDPVAPFALGAPAGPPCQTEDVAFAGEAVLILNAVPGGDVLEIAAAGKPLRYVALGVLSSPAGDYAVDGFARLARPLLALAAGGFTTQTRAFPLPPAPAGAATLDWRMKP